MPRIADRILDAVIYLYDSVAAAVSGEQVGGTGFLVGVPSLTHPDMQHLYAVTNGHIIRPAIGNAPIIRLNTQRGDTDIIERSEDDWILHPDGTDLAIFPLGLSSEQFRFHFIPIDMLLTKDTMSRFNIGPGDESFMVGRFINHEGRQRNLPTVRFGNISMMPWESVRAGRFGVEQESFLVETRSLPGYSGSPVFVYLDSFFTVPREGLGAAGVKRNMWLLGIDWAHLRTKDPVRDPKQSDKSIPEKWYVEGNTGMMTVVPAWRLQDWLMEEDLVDERRRRDDQHEAELPDVAATLDAPMFRNMVDYTDLDVPPDDSRFSTD